MNFSKSDFWRAIIAGELIVLLALPVFKNLGLFTFFFSFGSSIFYLSVALWLIFLPLASAAGLFIVFRVSISRWPVCYQIGKYGLIGLLNTFLALGILNLLILISGIVKGLWFDAFVLIAFWGSVTNAFFWNKFWTFCSPGIAKIKKEYVKFFIVSGAVSLINVSLMHFLVNFIGALFFIEPKIWANIAFFLIIPVSFLGNFFGWKIFVFKNNP